MGLDPDFWTDRRVVVTGHTGFKGGWLTAWLRSLGAEVVGFSVDVAPDGIFDRTAPIGRENDHRGDIGDFAAISNLISTTRPSVVFHLAAQSLVRQGYRERLETFRTNVMGTANLMEALARVGTVEAAVIATTDKVYASTATPQSHTEDDPLGGDDPYSASKAAAELVVNAWRASGAIGGCAAATVRAGNVIGGGDVAPDRLLPDLQRALRIGSPVLVRHPQSVRPWQFVLEPLAGYLQLAQRLAVDQDTPSALNFGPAIEGVTVADVLDLALAAWGSGRWKHAGDTSSMHEASHLMLDPTLASTTLGWRTLLTTRESVQWTVEWWKAESESRPLDDLVWRQIHTYVDRMNE